MKNFTKRVLPLLVCLVAFNAFGQDEPVAKKEKVKGGKKSVISPGTVINGNITAIADFDFDGKLVGNFDSEAALLIGKSAEIKGNVKAAEITVEGMYEGELVVAGLLSVLEKASVKGKAIVGDLSVKPGSTFIATTTMPDNYDGQNSKKKK